jgi:hypothetical protein
MAFEPTTREETPVQAVRITQLGSQLIDVPYTPGMTVRQALETAEVEVPEGFQVKVMNQPAALDTVLEPDQMVVLVGNIKGGTH